MATPIGFSTLDFVLFALTLLVSASIGFFHAYRGWRRGEDLEDFLAGSRRMPLIPTALSLLVSFLSGISILSYPAEVYTYGLVFAWGIVGATLAPIVSGIFVLPVLYKIRSSLSIYAYFEYRFGSTLLRSYASILYQLNTLVYLAVVLYAPSIALAGVIGIDVRILIVSVGVVCTLYTSVGGLKAVVWSDTFQALLMYAGLIALAIQGTRGAGGVANVWESARVHRRLGGFVNFDLNPLQYMTAWTGVFGGLFYWLASFAADQAALQRYYSLPTIRRARLAVFLNVPSMLVLMLLVIYIGLTMIPRFVHCDPRQTEMNLKKDQLVIYFMLESLSSIYGLPGLFLACIFSGTLSSVSSGINALSTVLLEDFLKPRLGARLTDRRARTITKITGLVYGSVAVVLAFAAEPLGGIFRMVSSVYGALGGPLVGMIFLGVLFPWANRRGACLGATIASAVGLWIFIGCTVKSVGYPELPTSTDQCPADGNGTAPSLPSGLSTLNQTEQLYFPDLPGVEKIYALSYMMYPCVSGMLTIILGLVFSLITGGNGRAPENRRFTFWQGASGEEEVEMEIREKKEKDVGIWEVSHL